MTLDSFGLFIRVLWLPFLALGLLALNISGALGFLLFFILSVVPTLFICCYPEYMPEF
jgi:hypothetical protein